MLALCRGSIDKCLGGGGGMYLTRLGRRGWNAPDDRGAEVDVEDGRKRAEVEDHLPSRHVAFISGGSPSCPLWALPPDPRDCHPLLNSPTPKSARAPCRAGHVYPARPLLRQLLTPLPLRKKRNPQHQSLLKMGVVERGLPPSKRRSFLHHLPCRATSRPWRAAFEQRGKTSSVERRFPTSLGRWPKSCSEAEIPNVDCEPRLALLKL